MLKYPKSIIINEREFDVVLELKSKKSSSAVVSGNKFILRISDKYPNKVQNEFIKVLIDSLSEQVSKSKRKYDPFIIDLTKDVKLLSGTYKYNVIFEKRRTLFWKHLKDNIINLYLPAHLEGEMQYENIRSIFLDSLKGHNKDFMFGYVKAINEKYFNYDVQQVSLGFFKSKWGTCRSDKIIKLNVMLLFCPLEILEYIVIHELAHVGMFNHSREFWKKLESKIDNRDEYDQWLAIHGGSLVNFKLLY